MPVGDKKDKPEDGDGFGTNSQEPVENQEDQETQDDQSGS